MIWIQLSTAAGSHAMGGDVHSFVIGLSTRQISLWTSATSCVVTAQRSEPLQTQQVDKTHTNLDPPTQLLNPAAKLHGINMHTPGIHMDRAHTNTNIHSLEVCITAWIFMWKYLCHCFVYSGCDEPGERVTMICWPSGGKRYVAVSGQ